MRDIRRRPRWWWVKPVLKRLLLVVLVLLALLGVGVGIRAYIVHRADKDLLEVTDELDRSDPGWRWHEIEAARQAIPDDENSATILLAANKLIPQTWPRKSALCQATPDDFGQTQDPEVQPLPERILSAEPNERLGDEVVEESRVELTTLAEAVAQLREVRSLPKGRYEVVLATNPLNTRVGYALNLRTSAALLELDAVMRAHEGDIDGSLESVRAALNSGRSLDDGPFLVCIPIRIACGSISVKTLEHALGQGLPSDGPLRDIATLLTREEAEITPAVQSSVRVERAMDLILLERMANGEIWEEENRGRTSSDPIRKWFLEWGVARPRWSRSRAPALRCMNRMVHASTLPRSQRKAELSELRCELQRVLDEGAPHEKMAALLLPGIDKVLDAHDRYQATLRTARVAIAVERYRLAHKDKQWPESLDQLVPAYLDKVPTDPFHDQPIRYRRVGKDVVIYSVGPDGVDDGGIFDPDNQAGLGTDTVFRLYHPDNRGVPAKPKPPPELPDMP
jgi:hypothetical protein